MGRRRKPPTEPIQLDIEDLSHDGRGVARWNDKVVFVQNALPGEQVLARINRTTRRFNEAMAEEILSASPDRVDPRCEFYRQCNGCTMMHLAPGKQIEFKFNTLKQNFSKIAGLECPEWAPPLQDSHWRYRRRARLSVRWVPGKERVLVGFREKNGRYVADMRSCEVLDERLYPLISELSDLFTSMDIRQDIAQVECARGQTDVSLIIRHLRDFTAADRQRLTDFADKHAVRIYLQSKGPDTVTPLDGDETPLFFTQPCDERDIRCEFSPSDFIQVNRGMNEKMIAQALGWLDIQPNESVLDLFCGIGNFTLPMALKAAHVTGIEGAQAMVEAASHNARINGIVNVEFHAADLTRDQSHRDWFKRAHDKVLIDPPRSGAWDVLPQLAAIGARRLVYVSCHPASLARDAGALVHEHGYRLLKAGAMDMFPHTSHVESMALFERV